MSFPKYAAYKDSGVQWLGEVPDHWFVGRTKHVCAFFTGWTPPTGNADSYIGINPWANISDLGPKCLNETSKCISDEAIRQSVMRLSKAGSLLFSFKLSIGQVSFAGRDLYTNEAIATFPPSDRLNLEFAYYALPLFLVKNAAENIYGAKLLNQELIRSAQLVLPDIEEQFRIATFLDRETAKIDALVAEQEKLVALLKEKRQSVISHAVTKGLDPSVPMKDSGVEWLGEVPAHWYVTPLRWLLSTPVTNGIFKKKNDFGKGVLLVNVFDIYRDDYRINYVSLDKVDCTLDEQRTYEVSEGDLFFVRSSLKREGVAVVAVADQIDESVVFECHLIRARPKSSKLQGRFASYVLNSAAYKARLVSLAKVTTMTTIDQEAIKSVEIVCPPIAEQRAIAQYLDDATKSFDLMTREAKSAIALLQERRTALISAAVTGQIDVRHLATA